MQEFNPGTAILHKFVASGFTVNSLHVAVYDGSETLVDSASATASGDGYYYCILPAPTSAGLYQAKWEALYGLDAHSVEAKSIDGVKFRVISLEVD